MTDMACTSGNQGCRPMLPLASEAGRIRLVVKGREFIVRNEIEAFSILAAHDVDRIELITIN